MEINLRNSVQDHFFYYLDAYIFQERWSILLKRQLEQATLFPLLVFFWHLQVYFIHLVWTQVSSLQIFINGLGLVRVVKSIRIGRKSVIYHNISRVTSWKVLSSLDPIGNFQPSESFGVKSLRWVLTGKNSICNKTWSWEDRFLDIATKGNIY